jgi:prefoldin subunit 5
MNLPLKAEIDEINKELYSLKKTVKELTSQIKELSLMNPSEEEENLGVHHIGKN